MFRSAVLFALLFSTIIVLLACGSNELPEEFQQNSPPKFDLSKITEGYGAVEQAWDSIDGHVVNERLDGIIDDQKKEFEIFGPGFADLLDKSDLPVPELVSEDLYTISSTLISPIDEHYPPNTDAGSFYHGAAPKDFLEWFYAFLDRMEGEGVDVPENYINEIFFQLSRYALDAIPATPQNQLNKAWLNDKVSELIDDINDDDFQNDFKDIAEVLCKLLFQGDYPLWIDAAGVPVNYNDIDPALHTNLNIGNPVSGTQAMLAWLNRIIHNPDTRPLLQATILELAKVIDPDPQAETARKLQDLLVNLERHFTLGGKVYSSDEIYSGHTSEIYSDAELGQSLREFFPVVIQLFTRSDRPNAIIKSPAGAPPVYPLDVTMDKLRGIGFDPDEIDLERSFYDLMRYDVWGRDRLTDPAAWPAPFFESLFFLTHATSHHGWRDGNDTAEVSRKTDPRDLHGHGKYVEDLTLNDALFSIKTHKTLNLLGVYDISLKSDDGNHHYRTKTPFSLAEVDELHTGEVRGDDKDYRFFFDQNYGVLQFLAGPGAGDLGAPDGGNPRGQSLGLNQYRAYAPNGLHETQLSGWTMGWGVRACFGGEGPYYYADPDAEVVSLDGQNFYKYLRPDGKVYALVNMDGTRYYYPTDDGDVEDPATEILSFNNKRQRDNRYKSKWKSDYYISHYSVGINPRNHYFTIDNSSGDTVIRELSSKADPAGALEYTELIAEDDPLRACSSREEAFFRNFQWVMNEKKMVLIIPLHMNLNALGRGMVFQILECHGWSGLANIRKYRDNHIWAKKNSNGASTLPGDYRIEVVTAATPAAALFVNDRSVYNFTLDCGNATPSIVGHNLPALYRLGFPRSPVIQRSDTAGDLILGSQDFQVGDAVWENRNAFMPLLFSLLSALREYSPPYDPDSRPGIDSGMRAFLNQIPVLMKPLFYYHRTGRAADPANTWIPRVYGNNVAGDYQGNPFLQSSADFYNGTPDNWFGSDEEMRHYQPAPIKTILNVLIDSDLNNPEKRCDGILPQVLETKTLSSLFKLLLNPSTGTPPMEQWGTSLKVTKGELTAINEQPESNKGMSYPPWMFACGVDASVDVYGAYHEYEGVRTEDLVLDDLIDALVGRDGVDADHEGYGLADYPDGRENPADWQDFYDTVDTLGDLLHPDSPYSISPNLLAVLDRIFARNELYTKEEISGLLYGTGRLFGHFDEEKNRWVYQGDTGFDDLYNILKKRLPAIHEIFTQKEAQASKNDDGHAADRYGENYHALLVLLSKSAENDGLMEFLLNTTDVPSNWETTLADIHRFLADKDIADTQNGQLWTAAAQLLRDMAEAVSENEDDEMLDPIYEQYGFQMN